MSRPTRGHGCFLPVRGCHPLWPDFPDGSGSYFHATGLIRVRSPLLAESRLMSFPPGTEMFQFPGLLSHPYGFRVRCRKAAGCPIRRSRDQRVLAPPPGFSQRATSFIISRRQGIHQMPFVRSTRPAATPPERATNTYLNSHPGLPTGNKADGPPEAAYPCHSRRVLQPDDRSPARSRA